MIPGRVLPEQVIGGQLVYLIDGREAKSTVICERLRELGASLRPRMHPTQLWDWIVQDRDYSWRRVTGVRQVGAEPDAPPDQPRE